MLSANPFSSRFMTAAFIAATIAVFGLHLRAQNSHAINSSYVRITGIPDDWSHHRVIFSNPGTEQEAIRKGKHDQWLRIVNDPRYVIHQLKRGLPSQGPSGEDTAYWRALKEWDAKERGRAEHDRHERDHHGKPSLGGAEIKGDWGMSMGSGAKVGAGQFPAKFSFLTDSAYCSDAATPDFVVYNTGLTGSGGATGSAGATGQASVIAFDNLYSGCTPTPKPTVYWAYNTGGTVVTSPVISADGSQLAFVQTPSSGNAALVILKWAAGEGSAGGSPNAAGKPSIPTTSAASGTAYAACRGLSASCYVTLTFNSGGVAGTHADTNSSPYYDYFNDVLYVGDNAGVLHKFTGIFNGAPVEITSGGTSTGWPQTMASGATLTSPIYDIGTGNVFVGSSGGHLYSIPGGGGSTGGGSNNITTSILLSNGTGVIDAPVVDSAASTVYVFVSQDTSAGCSSNGQACTARVYQFTTSFTGSSTPLQAVLGGHNYNTTNGPVMYDGTFDNIYFTSGTPNLPTGNLYVCGFSSGGTTPTLWQVPIASNVMGTPVMGPAVANGAGNCSPVTEFLNGSTDYIFLSVTASNKTTPPISCPSGAGCLMSFDVSSGATLTNLKATTATALEASGTSGVIIDNSVSASPSGASEVYFTPLANQTCGGNGTQGAGTGGCAIQASQAALQ